MLTTLNLNTKHSINDQDMDADLQSAQSDEEDRYRCDS